MALSNEKIWKEYLEVSKIHNIEFVWVKGHDSNEFNNRCDKLAVEARLSNELFDDIGFNSL